MIRGEVRRRVGRRLGHGNGRAVRMAHCRWGGDVDEQDICQIIKVAHSRWCWVMGRAGIESVTMK